MGVRSYGRALPMVWARAWWWGKRTRGERMEGSIARSAEGSSGGGGLTGAEAAVRLRMGRGQGQYVGGIVEWVVEGELQTG